MHPRPHPTRDASPARTTLRLVVAALGAALAGCNTDFNINRLPATHDATPEAAPMTCSNGGTVCGQGCDLYDQTAVPNCGECGRTCTPMPGTNVRPHCVNGGCTTACDEGFTMCGATGCVNLSSNPLNCGACGTMCGIRRCVAGQCQ